MLQKIYLLTINGFDLSIIHYINSYFSQEPLVEPIANAIENNSLFKGVLIFCLFWGFWFIRQEPIRLKNRSVIIGTIFSAFMALAVARLIAFALPFRARPVNNLDLNLDFPIIESHTMIDWSSFPSDHATFFGALACGLLFINRYVGTIVLFYVVFVICLLRVFLGYHYPSDILVGLFIGMGITICVNMIPKVRNWIAKKPLEFCEKHPDIFYFLAFFISYQMASLFEDTKSLASTFHQVIHHFHST